MHARAIKIVRECVKKHRMQDPGYSRLAEIMKWRLRTTVGDAHWEKAEHYYALLRNERQLKNNTNTDTNALISSFEDNT